MKSEFGYLEIRDYSAVANITLTFEIKNTSKNKSLDIESVYFYTGENWDFYIENSRCVTSTSDSDKPPLQHFIKSPINRLPPNGWAPLVLTGKKTVWTRSSGEPCEDAYILSGRTFLEVITNEGPIAEKINLNIVADDIPF